MQSSPVQIPRINAGGGRISLISYGSTAVLTELASTYPLKLLAPRLLTRHDVAIVYLLTYGGGLVGGDEVQLTVTVDSRTVLILLSQGSTKVFKIRPGQRLSSMRPNSGSTDRCSPAKSKATTQNMTFTVAAEGFLLLLPDPVTCFRSASYNQTQTFQLSKGASIVVLDWLTSGRMSMGEEWAFSRYYSANEVWVEGRRVARDVMLLDEEQLESTDTPTRAMSDRLAPYSCYAMVILYGPQAENTIAHLVSQYDQISIFKTKAPDEMVWSLSRMTSGQGVVVRLAGKETETVKRWLGGALVGLQDTVGGDVYQKVFG